MENWCIFISSSMEWYMFWGVGVCEMPADLAIGCKRLKAP